MNWSQDSDRRPSNEQLEGLGSTTANEGLRDDPLDPRPSSPFPTNLPDHLQRLLDEWCEANGILTAPPCASSHSLSHDPYRMRDGLRGIYLHRNGNTMDAKRYAIHIEGKSVLVVKCKGVPPSIISHWQSRAGKWTDGWYRWIGGHFWEDVPFVRKIPANGTNTPQHSLSIDSNSSGFPQERHKRRRIRASDRASDPAFDAKTRPKTPVLPAETSLDNILYSKTRSDRSGSRKTYVGLDPPQQKKRKNSELSDDRFYDENDLQERAYQVESSPEVDCQHLPLPLASRWSPLRFAVGSTARGENSNSGTDAAAPRVHAAHGSGPGTTAARSALTKSMRSRELIPPMTPSSLPSWSPTAQAGAFENRLLVSDSLAVTIEQIGPPRTNEPREPLIKSGAPESVASFVDLTSEDDHIHTGTALMYHIQKHAMIVFLPIKSHQPRIREFGICNTLEKFFAQAYQAKLFAQTGSLGRLLEVKIGGVTEPRGIAEGDKEDFEDFVRALTRAPCWRTTGAELAGDCKVEVRLQTV